MSVSMDFLEGLNPRQKEAVAHVEGLCWCWQGREAEKPG